MKSIPLIIASVLFVSLASAEPMPMPSYHTKGTPTGKPTGPLKPGEYWWSPRVSPEGPVVVLISLPLQTANVYRNGLLVGRSSVSTGAPGHQTPTGVFTILEKKESHSSKKYDNAPMPNMQRLTWSGIAMHSGYLPGRPSSHGCIRMPYDFSMHLFEITARGGTVIVGDEITHPRFAANPGIMLAPSDFKPEMLRPLAPGEYQWYPERSTKGPVTVLLSSADRAVYVYRNGEPIGRAPVEISGYGSLGNAVFTMLEGVNGSASPWAPGRPARKWMNISNHRVNPHDLAKRIHLSPEFAQKLYDTLTPGATIIVTDITAAKKAERHFNILSN